MDNFIIHLQGAAPANQPPKTNTPKEAEQNEEAIVSPKSQDITIEGSDEEISAALLEAQKDATQELPEGVDPSWPSAQRYLQHLEYKRRGGPDDDVTYTILDSHTIICTKDGEDIDSPERIYITLDNEGNMISFETLEQYESRMADVVTRTDKDINGFSVNYTKNGAKNITVEDRNFDNTLVPQKIDTNEAKTLDILDPDGNKIGEASYDDEGNLVVTGKVINTSNPAFGLADAFGGKDSIAHYKPNGQFIDIVPME